MINDKYIYSHETKSLKQWIEPPKFGVTHYNTEKIENAERFYEKQIASLPTIQAEGLNLGSEMDGKFLIEGEDFEIVQEYYHDGKIHSKHSHKLKSDLVALPIHSVDTPSQQQDKEDELNKQLYPEANEKPEYVICAAIWFKDEIKREHQPKNVESGFVVAGRRHHNIFSTVAVFKSEDEFFKQFSEAKKNAVQGFLTSKDRFVDRKEGAAIALSASQITRETNCLFSEDLY